MLILMDFKITPIPRLSDEPTNFQRASVYDYFKRHTDSVYGLLLEESIFSKRDETPYRVFATRMMDNLRRNGEFIYKTYKPGELHAVPIHCLRLGTTEDIFHESVKSKTEHYKRLLDERVSAVDKLKPTKGIMTCRNPARTDKNEKFCNSVDLAWEQKQTRSADEGMCIFMTCLTCKYRWKM